MRLLSACFVAADETAVGKHTGENADLGTAFTSRGMGLKKKEVNWQAMKITKFIIELKHQLALFPAKNNTRPEGRRQMRKTGERTGWFLEHGCFHSNIQVRIVLTYRKSE